MCDPGSLAAIGSWFAGTGAPAPGATAAAGAGAATAGGMSLGSMITAAGTVISTVGSISQGIAGSKAAKAQADAIGRQMGEEQALTAVQDNRTRAQYRSQIAQQRAELAARGVSLDSPTAILLGQTAAQEMSFDSQAIRASGAARQAKLSYSQAAVRAEGQKSLLTGFTSAAGSLLSGSQQLWPGMKDVKIGSLFG